MIPCSVYIVTLNCGPWLQDTLQSVQDFSEVIILDSGSTDDTYAIAQSFANTRISHQDWQGYAAQKSLALAQCKNDWVLNLDGDEVLSKELKAEIEQTIQANQIDALITPINDVFLGVPNSKHTKKHAKVRFFRKSKGQYDLENKVHENVIVDGQSVKAEGDIYHYGESSIFVKVEKNNQYSNLKAAEKFQKGKKPSLLKLSLVMPVTFLKSYFIRRSCLNGWRGFVNSMINAFYAFLKEAKLFEQHQNAAKKKQDQP
ncbi:glycosyltransferase family 2 protein [Acinetobacter cumulans]|jgi:glycosyltransferase involved in cell wall biosynthesis|uniref:Glycosyltransferase family 2 protein n=1 Tax=Acinetobacter cumulans TaxID=2136182 RepID=A0A3A8G1R5_9GAMM|nr:MULTISPECIES: glycosyltransferase family 2 protein [Acinetobacter]NWK74977.1 glycosyltransferase family 2 protein [Acinetobacter sp. SwsAc6]QCO20231.1 glycosyltransferase [Acinetobacter cumulans]RFS31742.1 glycosyltransferase family 2 protein [Acinetobacter sp. SWAC5]RKG49388.1 glycosyltransferase family 2 protein [Acinetobacter cumulans]RKG53005.1 glycosyltransferase family 2 protein [Acinetobacter cumulans]